MTQALTDQRQCLISPESLLELKRQHRRLRGLISQLENEPQTPANHMTILDLDEIQSQIANQIAFIEISNKERATA